MRRVSAQGGCTEVSRREGLLGTVWAGYLVIQLYSEVSPVTMRSTLCDIFSTLILVTWSDNKGEERKTKKTTSIWYTTEPIWGCPCTNQIWCWPATLYRKAIFEQGPSHQKLKKLNFQVPTCSLKILFYPRQETSASMEIQNASSK